MGKAAGSLRFPTMFRWRGVVGLAGVARRVSGGNSQTFSRRWMSSAAEGGHNVTGEYGAKLEQKDKTRKLSDVPLGQLKADGSSKRFYQHAGYESISVDDLRTGASVTQYCLTLDGRQVRTPANKLLALPTEQMAMALALEFDVQDMHILPFTMPMTTIATTAIDQISVATVRKHAVAGMMRVFKADLLCLRSTHPPELVELESNTWGRATDWVSRRYGGEKGIKVGLIEGEENAWFQHSHPQEIIDAIEADLNSRHAWRLTALDQITGSTGSLVLSLALCEGELDAEAAFKCARLHEEYQVGLWGKVEQSGMGGHDIDEVDMRARIAAAHLYHRLLPASWR